MTMNITTSIQLLPSHTYITSIIYHCRNQTAFLLIFISPSDYQLRTYHLAFKAVSILKSLTEIIDRV
jgi:hypothetical protein